MSNRIILLEHSDSAASARLGTVIRDHGYHLDIRRLHRGDRLPNSLADTQAVISMGGPQNVDQPDGHAWMLPEMEYLKKAHESQRAVIGVCLGCQMLATALGGEVARFENGRMELGWHPISLSFAGMTDPIFAGQPARHHSLHWHGRHITKLPQDAVTLCSSDMTPVQAFRAGMRTYGFQYHFEGNRDTVARWGTEEQADRERAGLSYEQLMDQTDRYYPAFERLAYRLCTTLIACAISSSR
ncbi:MAG: type 1 glutamine amidotransferase [Planctomycetes bacterium]|nr:type 1 glutamine amidotransferase [Planctomycetota bacterium]NOG53561.1 type 1 glutamine amidotransferase [Planctomycetota bacterium]